MMDLTGCPTEHFDFTDCQDLIKSGELFNKLNAFDEVGHLISASTPGEDKFTETGKPKEQGGLVPGHAYSVIQVKEYQGARLLNIRNPWGSFEWQGAWGDNDKVNWTDDIVAHIKPVFGDDGTFWMCF